MIDCSLRRGRLACSFVLISTVFALGCSDDGTRQTTISSNIKLSRGNWQVVALGADNRVLHGFSGAIEGAGGKLTAKMHVDGESSCVPMKTSFELTTEEASGNVITFSGPLAGGTLSLTGVLADDGRALLSPTYSVSGGSCVTASAVSATAFAFQPISGHYSGSFSDGDGQVIAINAHLEQASSSDPDGTFTLSGEATLPNNPCFPASVPISQTQVTGGTFTFTYGTDQNHVSASGRFSQDGSSLDVTQWTANGSCGSDHGIGSMNRQ